MSPLTKQVVSCVATGAFAAVLFGAIGFSSAQTQTNVRPSQTTQPLNVLVADCSKTTGLANIPLLLVPANSGRKFISFQTQPPQTGTIPTVYYSYTSNAPAAGAAGTFTLYPGATGGHESISVPSNAVYVVSAQPSTVISCSQG